jgi:flavin reductase (DIM6/NTAB) family NADH-FMN oxidoreductase RutF
MMVAVRLSRYTFTIIETAADFTVSIPAGNMDDELMFCGTQSGRDYDKFKECDLEIVAAQKVVSPIINTPGRHYECKIVYKSAMDSRYLDPSYDADIYPEKDYHTLYFGEIVDCYELES